MMEGILVGTNEDVTWKRRMNAEMAAGLPKTLMRMRAAQAAPVRAGLLATVPALFAESRKANGSDGLVYFIRCGDYVKIGFTVDLFTRLSNLRAANPMPLHVYGHMAGTIALERELHWQLNGHHHHGEWFHWNEEVRAAIDAIVPAALREQYYG